MNQYILTFDIEEWFHLLDHSSTQSEIQWGSFESRIHSNVERILILLNKYNIKATFFCLGWTARKYPEIIKNIHSLGYEIGNHSDLHQLHYSQNLREFNEDLESSLNSLEDLTGINVKSYRAPGFSFTHENNWVFEILCKHGIEVDSSIFPTSRAHGGYANFKSKKPCLIKFNGLYIKEFPINTVSILGKDLIFSGGGYFRLMPYVFLKKLMRDSDYVMTYFHPRDFDPEQPVIQDLSYIRKFKSYYGLSSAYDKLEKLLQSFNFIDLSTADSQIDWTTVTTVDLSESPLLQVPNLN